MLPSPTAYPTTARRYCTLLSHSSRSRPPLITSSLFLGFSATGLVCTRGTKDWLRLDHWVMVSELTDRGRRPPDFDEAVLLLSLATDLGTDREPVLKVMNNY